MKEESGNSVVLSNSDTSEGVLIKKPKTKKNEEIGQVRTIESTEGNKKASEKYGVVHGLLVTTKQIFGH